MAWRGEEGAAAVEEEEVEEEEEDVGRNYREELSGGIRGAGMGWVASDHRPPAPGPTREMEGWMDELGVVVGASWGGIERVALG